MRRDEVEPDPSGRQEIRWGTDEEEMMRLYRDPSSIPDLRPEDLKEVLQRTERTVESLRKRHKGRRRFSWALVPAVCSLVAATLLFLLWPERRTSLEDRLDGSPQRVFRGQKMRTLSPLGVLDSDRRVFAWDPVEGACRYLVTIRAVDESVVYQGMHESFRVDLGDVLDLTSATEYTWRVEALDKGESLVSRSDFVHFSTPVE